MKLSEIVKLLQETLQDLGDIECAAFTIDHGPFELCVNVVKEDEDNHAHVQFGPDLEADVDLTDKIMKDEPLADCARCGSSLNCSGLCPNTACPFSNYQQTDPRGWSGHPDFPSQG